MEDAIDIYDHIDKEELREAYLAHIPALWEYSDFRGQNRFFGDDFHNECYYGDKNAEGVRGIQAKNGTSWGHVYFTIDWLGGSNPHLRHRERHRTEQGLCCARERCGKPDTGDGLQIRTILEGR